MDGPDERAVHTRWHALQQCLELSLLELVQPHCISPLFACWQRIGPGQDFMKFSVKSVVPVRCVKFHEICRSGEVWRCARRGKFTFTFMEYVVKRLLALATTPNTT